MKNILLFLIAFSLGLTSFMFLIHFGLYPFHQIGASPVQTEENRGHQDEWGTIHPCYKHIEKCNFDFNYEKTVVVEDGTYYLFRLKNGSTYLSEASHY
jgi:hypothetical protein